MTQIGHESVEAPADPSAADVVLRNVAELQQRQRARELGTTLALSIFRLLRIAQFHALDNMAVIQQLDQTVEAIQAFAAQTNDPLSLLFARGTVFVAGQLLKASRTEYEAALELGAMVEKLGLSEIVIQPDVDRSDLTELARLFQPGAEVDVEGGMLEPTPRIRLRRVSSALFDEEEEELTPEEQVLRTYASAVVVMRRVYDNLKEGRYQLPHQAKRLAQKLVMLSEGDTPAFLGVTAMRNLNHDEAGRAVNRAILAVSVGRQLTEDLSTLARIAMSGLFLDVADPLLAGIVGLPSDGPVVIPRLTEEEERRKPGATALVLTALGQLRSASMVRTVVAYESHWMDQGRALGPLYGGARRATVAARIVRVAHRFNELLSPDLAASRSMSPDEVISVMKAEAPDATERAMISLLVGALGIFPSGTAVQLNTGEKGVVIRTPDDPSAYARPAVRLVLDAHGRPLDHPELVDLALDPNREVVAVVPEGDPRLAAASQGLGEPPSTQRPGQSNTDRPTAPPPNRQRSEARPTSRPPGKKGPPGPPPSRRSAPPSGPPSSASRRGSPSSRRPMPSSAPRAPLRSPTDDAPTVAVTSPIHALVMGTAPSVDPDAIPDSVEISEVEPSAPSAPSSHWRNRPAARPGLSSSVPGGFTPPNLSPSAKGSLARTPFSHLILYLLDKGLSGTMVFREAAQGSDIPMEHAVYAESGSPCKVVLGRRVASLASLLVADGVVEQNQLQSEPLSQPPDHDGILENEVLEFGLARPDDISRARDMQLLERLSALFSLPSTTEYAFYAGLDLLEDRWGKIPGMVQPLALLTAGLREHPETAAMQRMLGRVGLTPLRLHPSADLDLFEMNPDERAVAEAIGQREPSLAELETAFPDAALVHRVVYQLLLARSVLLVKDG
ncbi:MAG: hypothetical protein KC776_00715 [Myxococcales bacterium]|nr:hypothetical protein [Myxococcales bacterium]